MASRVLTINGSRFSLPSSGVRVAVCLDGTHPAYLAAALKHGVMPWLQRKLEQGAFYREGLGMMPSFTNPNNMSIVTTCTPAVHGICGNYYMHEGRERMMNEPSMLRCPTLFPSLVEAGCDVVLSTSKAKLLALLRHGLEGESWLAMSAEKAQEVEGFQRFTRQEKSLVSLLGPPPSIYSGEVSAYMMRMARVALELRRKQVTAPAVMYLSTSDYIQHMHAPEEPEALAFQAAMDTEMAALEAVAEDVVLGFTADHGMSSKLRQGRADVMFLEPILAQAELQGQVVLPITDPYVKHHGALGGFAWVHLAKQDVQVFLEALKSYAKGHGASFKALDRATAAKQFQLPEDRIGDVVLVGEGTTVFGKSAEYHEIPSALRTHGAEGEDLKVPIFVSKALEIEEMPLRNKDLFHLLLR